MAIFYQLSTRLAFFSSLLVPVLRILFKMQHFPAPYIMHWALGTSMATILFTSLASMRKHHQHGAVNWDVVRTMTPGILFGTALGALCAASVSPRGLGIFFVLFVYCAAIQIWWIG
ncbi:sulfite exporter TauE/SafE family protein, partial [Candidatus Nitrotoga sp. HW29]|uniref:sulfite exporter TauE/SafE family protein n=1 Tax=Candidatus Nitrotoga sp. HW29 TaxID=2886963 RepID=UPI001EF3BD15